MMKVVKEIIEVIFFLIALAVIVPMVLDQFNVKKTGWEYKIEYVSDSNISELNEIGEKGFDAVSCRRARSGESSWGYECIFKRVL